MRGIKVFPIAKKFIAVLPGHLLSPASDLLRQLSAEEGAIVQAVDADAVAGLPHLLHAVYLAIRNWSKAKRYTKQLGLEVLCYIAADHQISDVIRKVGVSPRTKRVLIFAIAPRSETARRLVNKVAGSVKIRPDFGVLEPTRSKQRKLRRIFSISKNELKVAEVSELIMERVASLSLL